MTRRWTAGRADDHPIRRSHHHSLGLAQEISSQSRRPYSRQRLCRPAHTADAEVAGCHRAAWIYGDNRRRDNLRRSSGSRTAGPWRSRSATITENALCQVRGPRQRLSDGDKMRVIRNEGPASPSSEPKRCFAAVVINQNFATARAALACWSSAVVPNSSGLCSKKRRYSRWRRPARRWAASSCSPASALP